MRSAITMAPLLLVGNAWAIAFLAGLAFALDIVVGNADPTKTLHP